MAWSPDGEHLAFTRGTGDRFRVPVHAVPAGEVGARPRLVGLADGIASVVTFSGDGESLLVVAHRLSTVVDADQIVVLEGGRVVAVGRHDELLETSPLYRELAAHQLLVPAEAVPLADG